MASRRSAEFLALAESVNALKFGSFTLKSGRLSPYFFNSSEFSSGSSLAQVGDLLAELLQEIPCDCLFGPAYKGIPLATVAAASCARLGRDIPVVFNRKEAKTHGEGGEFFGASEVLKRPGCRVVLIDDVISAGTAVAEAVASIRKFSPEAEIAAVVVLLDRQERASETSEGAAISASEKLAQELGVPVFALAKFDDLAVYTETRCSEELRGRIAEYSRRYRV